MTSNTIKGNTEKNALKANAPAHCAPSIRKNFLTARQSIAQTLRVFYQAHNVRSLERIQERMTVIAQARALIADRALI